MVFASWINLEKTKAIMDNNYFVAPKAFGFIFMWFAIRGAFNRWPLNLIHLKYVFILAKAIAFGFAALGAGMDGK